MSRARATSNKARGRTAADALGEASHIVAEVTLGLDVLARMIERAYSPLDEGDLPAGHIVEGTRAIIAGIASHAKCADGILADLNQRVQEREAA